MKTTARGRPGLTLNQMMRFVVLWSAACLAMTPFAELWRRGVLTTAGLSLIAAFAMPLVLASLSLLLHRRSQWRDRLILIGLLASVTTGLGITSFFSHRYIRVLSHPGRTVLSWAVTVMLALGIAYLGFAFVFLATRLGRSFRAGRTAGPPRMMGHPIRAEASD